MKDKKKKDGINAWGFGYDKSKHKAKSIYSKIGRVHCPALNNDIVAFTSEGFNHLVRKGRIPRPKNEQKRRFVLVQYIEKIIKNPKAVILYRRKETKSVVNRHGEKITIQSIADFWTFITEINDCKIKVVIRQVEDGQKKFQSVMGDGVKISKNKKKPSGNTKKSPKNRRSFSVPAINYNVDRD